MGRIVTLLEVFRQDYDDDRTRGGLTIDGVKFCYTLEDTVRPPGVKVYGETAIPAGAYRVVLRYSPKFGRVLPMILDVEGFEYVLFHGGNRPEDTEGCILVAFHKAEENGKAIIYGSAEKELVRRLKPAHEIRLRIV